ncbi:MAG: hypothetical protein ACNA8W_15920, partial [Bradymonadaceae bacterium]
MMRSFFSYPCRLISLVILVFLFAACGGGETHDERAPLVLIDDPPGEGIGKSCASIDDCLEGLFCEMELFDGQCSQACEVAEECLEGQICVPMGAQSLCTPTCSQNADCPAGNRCESFSYGTICLPADLPHPTPSFEETKDVLGVRCDAEVVSGGQGQLGPMYKIDFTLAEDTTSFMMVPFVTGGRAMPVSLHADGEVIDLRSAYRHQNTRLSDLIYFNFRDAGSFGEITFDWPITVPYAPQFASMVKPGKDYNLYVTTDREPPCFYLIEASRPGTVLDLNFYFVGLDHLTAETAAQDTDLAEILARFDSIYNQAGVSLGHTRFFDVSQTVNDRYQILRSTDDVYKLTAYGTPPSDTLDGHLSVDVFMVQDIQIPGGDGVLGMSPSLPGAAGMHGNARNGVVFHTADIGKA